MMLRAELLNYPYSTLLRFNHSIRLQIISLLFKFPRGIHGVLYIFVFSLLKNNVTLILTRWIECLEHVNSLSLAMVVVIAQIGMASALFAVGNLTTLSVHASVVYSIFVAADSIDTCFPFREDYRTLFEHTAYNWILSFYFLCTYWKNILREQQHIHLQTAVRALGVP